jgi:hypothetical protein
MSTLAILITLGIILLLLFILAFIFWILMLIDAAKRKMNEGEKVAWILIVIFLGIIGAIIYYFVVKQPEPVRKKK